MCVLYENVAPQNPELVDLNAQYARARVRACVRMFMQNMRKTQRHTYTHCTGFVNDALRVPPLPAPPSTAAPRAQTSNSH